MVAKNNEKSEYAREIIPTPENFSAYFHSKYMSPAYKDFHY